jgi:NAD(P)-dependent dehydrogenase (short-subunit alcohol dehydrogenase family)
MCGLFCVEAPLGEEHLASGSLGWFPTGLTDSERAVETYSAIALLSHGILADGFSIRRPRKKGSKMKIWFITGASRGLGVEFAKAALDSGDSVVATSRSAESVTKALGTSDRLLAFALDVTKPGAAEKAVHAALLRFGRIDVLVNNAGYGIVGALEELSAEEVLAQYKTNVFGLLDVTKAVLPAMRAQRDGHIVNISSVGGFYADAGISAYCGTKFAVEGLSEALAKEVGPLGIRVTIVEPGYFRTELLSEESARYAAKEIPDYDATSGAVRKGIAAMHGKQAGDPRKLALALVHLVNDRDPPLRFLAGADAVGIQEQKLEQTRSELGRWRELSTSLAHEV